ncbi:MAG: hypothetical protein LBR12_04675 [Opitutaceae bacterium]|jgi:hypothetical protein|nr:hypothetical protein [Opitutaceae bacterium]
MGKTIRTTLGEVMARPLTKEQKAGIERLSGIRDEDIDFSDAPECTDAELAGACRPGHGGARPGAGRKPSGNVPLYVRVPAAWAEKWRAQARKTKRPLSEVILGHISQPAGR